MDDLSREVEELFALVVDLAPGDRDSFLDDRCRDDPVLRSHVEELLRFDAKSIGFDRGTRFRPSTDPLGEEEPGSRIGPYRIVRKLGEGGMGIVYLAEQEEPIRRRVALKIIKVGMDTRQVSARFEAERQVLAMLDHPGIAKVLDAGSTGSGRPYFIMEAVDGDRITDHCDRLGLGIHERLELFVSVCQAVHHAHLKGIIHRDLKPSNVLITEIEGDPIPKVIDFGIAKATGPTFSDLTQLTEHQQIIGTPEYMSPEQAGLAQLDIDTRSDIYSLGVLLYELLTETTPLEPTALPTAGYAEIQRNIQEVDPPTPSRRVETLGDRLPEIATRRACEPAGLGRRLRGELDWIVMKCLEKDRDRRYESARTLARDIQHHLADEPVIAGPPGTGYRVRKFIKRHRTAFAASAAAIAMISLLVVGFVFALYEKSEEERLAREKAERELSLNNIERGRILGRTGSLAGAETLLWNEYFHGPDRSLARWALWEMYSGAPILSTVDGHARLEWSVIDALPPSEKEEALYGQQIEDVAFHPGGDWIATGSRDHRIKLWSTRPLRCEATLEGHRGVLTAIEFAPDGRTLASSSLDGTVRLWGIPSGEPTLVIAPHDHGSNCVRFSPAGGLLVSCGRDGQLRFWDPDTAECLLEFQTGARTLSTLAFDRTGQRIAAAGDGGRYIGVWEVTRSPGVTLRPLATFDGHVDVIHTLEFGPDEDSLYSGSRDRTVCLWDVGSSRLEKRLQPDVGPIRRLRIHPGDGSLWVGAMWAIEAWSPDLDRRISSRGGSAMCMALAKDGEHLCVGKLGLQFWETRLNRCLETVPAHRGIAYSLATRPDGGLIATGGEDGLIHLWDPLTREERGTLEGHAAQVNAVRFCSDDRWLASASIDGEVLVWDLESRTVAARLQGFSTSGAPLAFRPQGDRVATGEDDGTVSVWESPSGHPVGRISASRSQIVSMSFSPDGLLLATTARDRTIRIWDSETLELVRELVSGHSYWRVEFSADGKTLAAGTWSGTAVLWDVTTGAELGSLKDQHRRVIRSLAFPPRSVELFGERRVVATVSDDGTVKIWDRDTLTCLLTLDAEANAGYGVEFLSGESAPHVVSTYADGTLGFWDLTYFDRHIAGNLEYQRARSGQE